ncbi:SHOCT domain-containing protein [Candidatus Woesearchaeota archaeon]|nr:SHOCT domain-containing protein [Candidatus Woesearchaeota archaeon]
MMNRGGFGGMMNNWFGSGYGMMGGSYPAFGGFMMIFWILVIILIVYLLYKLLNGHGLNLGTTSIEILKKRYASGEITKKQYERMKRQLR